ncbi:septum formation inhibitor Maf [Poritiphilus flavus]|uniref:Septum formation inhibitor Maf n=1 Tax=Poritiphilus flavus TaxID=2697053 RepID=A0A6L9EEA1_9FLAO|nr:septum formation inhibitor Maf [Poritiphilus flavus]NAS12971.1 septum formation inhibitor Maf [Poritiphilus flavus]
MKKGIRIGLLLLLFAGLIISLESCKDASKDVPKEIALNEEPATMAPAKPLSEEFKKYWYAGEAEITSYKLEQARYGEIRDGHAVLIYVTEPFLADKQVKADRSSPDNVQVLKLNATKKYLTGIYPYSIMSSTFYPVSDNQHAIKLSTSVQEWCGHVYAQLNNRDQFEVMSHSYFESEADQLVEMEKAILENELWTKIRIDPKGLPSGDIEVLPSLEYIRVGHKGIQAYKANAKLTENGELSTYEISYPELERTLSIQFSTEFPHTIEGWTETFKSGFGPKAKLLTSRASRMKKLKTPYWRQNGNKDLILRDSLGL